ncbi:unnamed protein product [Moneuplotes crassus]|uniref:Cyclic nucleotide-binding domain-containing protein n=1 Tax=Euplotes crassus TaxID=5936 RepID=A0AAD1UB82_EUPCR|nr:unnamed protein product [Moneuplotes crassus]
MESQNAQEIREAAGHEEDDISQSLKYSQVTPQCKRNKIVPYFDQFEEQDKEEKEVSSMKFMKKFMTLGQNKASGLVKNRFMEHEELGFDEVSSSNADLRFQSLKAKTLKGSQTLYEAKENNRYGSSIARDQEKGFDEYEEPDNPHKSFGIEESKKPKHPDEDELITMKEDNENFQKPGEYSSVSSEENSDSSGPDNIGFRTDQLRFRRRAAIAKFKTMKSLEYNHSQGETIEENSEAFIKSELSKQKFLEYERRFSIIWKIVLSIFSFITLFLFAYETGYIIREQWRYTLIFTINIIIELAFLADIVVLLLKPFQHRGELYKGFRKISRFRLRSIYFYQDVFAAVPSVIIGEIFNPGSINSPNSIYGFLYVFKLWKSRYAFHVVDKIFNIFKSDLKGDIRRLLKLAIGLMFTVHIMACLHAYMGRNSNMSEAGWLVLSNHDHDSDLKIYLTSSYLGTVTFSGVGYGDIVPTNNDEVFFTIIMIAIGSMFYTVYISVVANFFSSMDRVNTLYLHYDASIDYFRSEYNIPDNLAYELRNFYKTYLREKELKRTVKIDTIMKKLPKTLKLEVLLFVHKDNLTKIPFFMHREEEFYEVLLPHLETLYFEPNEVIYKEGSRSLECYILIKGRIRNELTQEEVNIGEMFGFTDMIYERNRLETYQSEETQGKERIEVLYLKRDEFLDLLKTFPEIHEEIKMMANERNQIVQEALAIKHELEETDKKKKREALFSKRKKIMQLYNNSLRKIGESNHEFSSREQNRERLLKSMRSFGNLFRANGTIGGLRKFGKKGKQKTIKNKGKLKLLNTLVSIRRKMKGPKSKTKHDGLLEKMKRLNKSPGKFGLTIQMLEMKKARSNKKPKVRKVSKNSSISSKKSESSKESKQIKFSFNSSLMNENSSLYSVSESRNHLDREEIRGEDKGINQSKFKENAVEGGNKSNSSDSPKSDKKDKSNLDESNKSLSDSKNNSWKDQSMMSKKTKKKMCHPHKNIFSRNENKLEDEKDLLEDSIKSLQNQSPIEPNGSCSKDILDLDHSISSFKALYSGRGRNSSIDHFVEIQMKKYKKSKLWHLCLALVSIQENKNNLNKHLSFGIEITELLLETFNEIRNNKTAMKAFDNNPSEKHSQPSHHKYGARLSPDDIVQENTSSPMLFTEFCLDNLLHTFQNHLQMLSLASNYLDINLEMAQRVEKSIKTFGEIRADLSQ